MDILRGVIWSVALIPVALAPEPGDFNTKVREPGVAFLQSNPTPTGRAWRGHEYWRGVIGDLLDAYKNICSYSGSWTKRSRPGGSTAIEDSSVDHFVPRSKSPSQAYEWDNFRLSRARLNNRKSNHDDVLDPFVLPSGWFTIDFRSFLVVPNRELPDPSKADVQATIDRLELNSDDDYVLERFSVVRGYCLGIVTPDILDARWPFIASEMHAQDFDTVFLPRMQPVFKAGAGSP